MESSYIYGFTITYILCNDIMVTRNINFLWNVGVNCWVYVIIFSVCWITCKFYYSGNSGKIKLTGKFNCYHQHRVYYWNYPFIDNKFVYNNSYSSIVHRSFVWK